MNNKITNSQLSTTELKTKPKPKINPVNKQNKIIKN